MKDIVKAVYETRYTDLMRDPNITIPEMYNRLFNAVNVQPAPGVTIQTMPNTAPASRKQSRKDSKAASQQVSPSGSKTVAQQPIIQSVQSTAPSSPVQLSKATVNITILLLLHHLFHLLNRYQLIFKISLLVQKILMK